MKTLTYVAALVALCGSAAAYAAEPEAAEPISTDRPDISESSNVVGRGRFQIETGVQRAYKRGGNRNENTFTTPTLLRWGLDNRWEARLETEGYTRFRSSGTGGLMRTSGLSPLAPGVKYHIQDPREGSSRPSLGAIFHLSVPSGSSSFRANHLAGDLKLAADFELGYDWSLGTNFGLLVDRDDRGETFVAGLATASLSHPLTERLRAYAELALNGAAERPLTETVIVDGGFTYLLNLDTQLDVALGTDLSGRTSPDLFWTVGFSRRF